MSKDIVTPLIWKRVDEEKPPFEKWVWGLFVSEEGSWISDCLRHYRIWSDSVIWEGGRGNRCNVPLLWSDPEYAIHSLMGVIDGKGEHHADTR